MRWRGIPGAIGNLGDRAFWSCQKSHRSFDSASQNMLVWRRPGRLPEGANKMTDAHPGCRAMSSTHRARPYSPAQAFQSVPRMVNS
jgi:hypothetical protein